MPNHLQGLPKDNAVGLEKGWEAAAKVAAVQRTSMM